MNIFGLDVASNDSVRCLRMWNPVVVVDWWAQSRISFITFMCLWVVVWSGLVMLSIIIHWSHHCRVAGTVVWNLRGCCERNTIRQSASCFSLLLRCSSCLYRVTTGSCSFSLSLCIFPHFFSPAPWLLFLAFACFFIFFPFGEADTPKKMAAISCGIIDSLLSRSGLFPLAARLDG